MPNHIKYIKLGQNLVEFQPFACPQLQWRFSQIYFLQVTQFMHATLQFIFFMSHHFVALGSQIQQSKYYQIISATFKPLVCQQQTLTHFSSSKHLTNVYIIQTTVFTVRVSNPLSTSQRVWGCCELAHPGSNYFYCVKNCTDQNCILNAPTVLRKQFTEVKVYVCVVNDV